MQNGKEKCSRHHLRINSEGQDGGLLLANPMCGEIVSPGTPPSGSATGGGQLSRTSERGSLKKSRPKSPSLLRFFVRGGSRKISSADEDELGSSGSDHEDPFSPKGTPEKAIPDLIHTNKHTKASHRTGRIDSSSIESNTAHPGRHSRHHVSHRDSGFISERDSVSRNDEHDGRLPSIDDCSPPETPLDDYRPRGMEALEMLHNQLQILVKSECPEGGDDEVDMQSQVVISLQQQLDDMHKSVECLRQSDQNLRQSLMMAEQRALEAETKLSQSLERSVWLEQHFVRLAVKYQNLSKKHTDLKKIRQKTAIFQQMGRVAPTQAPHRVPQRVQSQREFDRRNSDTNVVSERPSTAEGFHTPVNPVTSLPTFQSSLSHTETCV